MDELWVAVSADAALRARLVVADGLAADAAFRHEVSPFAGRALARGLVCAALVPLSPKDEASVSLQWTGAGPLRSLFCEARPAREPEVGVWLRGNVKGKTAKAWGQDDKNPSVARGIMPGGLRIIRQADNGSASQGHVELVSGELDLDLETLFSVSEQVDTRVRVAVTLDDEGRVDTARGVLVQALPGADPERLRDLVLDVPADASLEVLLERALGPGAVVLEKVPLTFFCPCTRERALAGVAMLGHDELVDLIVKEGGAEVKCEMCATVRHFNQEDLLPLLEQLAPS